MTSRDLLDDAAAVAEPAARTRAQRMSPDERRAMIADAAVPLFLEHGAALTTRQLADGLDIAEGTIFRAFGDKETLVRASVERFFEQSRERMAHGFIDPSLPLEEKVAQLVRGTRQWMQNMMRMLSLVDRDEIPRFFGPHRDDDYRAAIAAAFAPDEGRLSIPVDRLGAVMRIAGIAANAARFGDGAGLSDDELVDFILYGIAGGARGKD